MNDEPWKWPTFDEDHAALAYIIKTYDIKTIFEFGTWEGISTQHMAEQPGVEKVTTLDIHEGLDVEYKHNAHQKTTKDHYGKFITSDKVTQIFCDSLKYEPTEEYDMVFVDANHDYEHIKNDTELALKMNPKVIVWHDYHSPGNPDVTAYINEQRALGKRIFLHPFSIVAYMEVEK